ncbi:MAG: hypothetical protein OK438_00700 [Thaumarchaeota archaeon]|nr:hypothetical protein [Nitrososphaerota archaeon]
MGASSLSVAAAIRRIGPQYALGRSNTGALLIAVALFSYLFGTSVQSDQLHLLSIMAFYMGGVFYLGGVKYLISTIPGLGIALSVLLLQPYGTVVQLGSEGVLVGLIFAFALMLWSSKKRTERALCRLCSSFRDTGASFCNACGRNLKPFMVRLPYARFAGFAIFSLLLVSFLAVTVPAVSDSPKPSFVTLTLGGIQNNGPFTPLPGWSMSGQVHYLSGQTLQWFDLTRGRTSIQAIISTSFTRAAAVGALGQLAGNVTVSPIAVNQSGVSLVRYSAVINGTHYEGVQGSDLVGVVNGSRLSQSYVAFDLQQTTSQFKSDNGASLYPAGAAVANWLSNSGVWFPSVVALLPQYQSANLLVADGSLGLIAVFLFSSIRTYDLAIERRLESTLGLTASALAHLRAFGVNAGNAKGEDLLAIARRVDPGLDERGFYLELNELSKRGLVESQVSYIAGEPVLLWRCLI